MSSSDITKKPLTDRIRDDIIGQYRRGNQVEVISRRVGIDKCRCLAVILDYILDVDAINENEKGKVK